MVIRNYQEDDWKQIEEFNDLTVLRYRYNEDFVKENIFCAIDEKQQILGVGHIAYDYKNKMQLDISINHIVDDTESNIIWDSILFKLIERAKLIKSEQQFDKLIISQYCYANDTEEINKMLSYGFCVINNCLVMKYDLTNEIPSVDVPKGIVVKENRFEDDESFYIYQKTMREVFDCENWSNNRLRWTMHGPGWNNYGAFDGEELVAGVMIWDITNIKSATEEIFVTEEYRNRGIARYIITETLKSLKQEGKEVATLSVFGNNKPAISLYKSIGYSMMDVMIEIGLEI